MRHNIEIEEALLLLLAASNPVEKTAIPLWDAAGRVLSQDIMSNSYLPPFDRSAMDGYAINAADTKDACSAQPVCLLLAEACGQNVVSVQPVMNRYCTQIKTGDPIPDGMNTVIKLEDTQRCGEKILINRPLSPGTNVVVRGEDIQPGDFLARRGSVISAPLIAVFASLGMSQVPVYRTVKTAFLSTGGELVNPPQELPPGKVYNSNLYGLSARCRELGAEPIDLGIAPDDAKSAANLIVAGLEAADLVVTTGGISVDEGDILADTLCKIGADFLFQGVAMKPGSPTLAAIKGGKTIVCLSGNPAASMVSFELLTVPVIKRLMGMQSILPHKIEGLLEDCFDKPSPQRRLLRGKMFRRQGETYVKLTGNQGNAVLSSLIDCNILIDIPAGSGPVSLGQSVSGFIVNSLISDSKEIQLRCESLPIPGIPKF